MRGHSVRSKWQFLQTALFVMCLLGAGQAQGLIVCVDACGHMAVELICADDIPCAASEASVEKSEHSSCEGACGTCVDFDLTQTVRHPESRPDGAPLQDALVTVSLVTDPAVAGAHLAPRAEGSFSPHSQPLSTTLRI